MEDKKYMQMFIDPTTFTDNDLPCIVLADDRRGFFGWAIRSHTAGNWNHAMIMHKPGMLVTQGFDVFKEIKLTSYMNDNQMLKFWTLKDMTQDEKDIVLRNVAARLALPWWKRGYDWFGIVGQFLRLKFIQNPLQRYCSEEVWDDFIGGIQRAFNVVTPEPSPSDLDRIFRINPRVFQCIGYWFGD